MKIFLDTNYFIAQLMEHHPLQERAQRIEKQLKQKHKKVDMYISNLIFAEIVTVVSQRVGKKIAISFGKELLESKIFTLLHITEDLQKLSWDIFQKDKRKNVSFVDCSIVAVMKEHGINNLLTFDAKDFNRLAKEYDFLVIGG